MLSTKTDSTDRSSEVATPLKPTIISKLPPINLFIKSN